LNANRRTNSEAGDNPDAREASYGVLVCDDRGRQIAAVDAGSIDAVEVVKDILSDGATTVRVERVTADELLRLVNDRQLLRWTHSRRPLSN
jgi:hypothetical protein